MCETWTTYRHIKALESFSQACLWRIQDIKWQSLIPDSIDLHWANASRMEMLLIYNQMYWAEYLTRIEDVSLPKLLFYRKLQCGKHPRHKSQICFKDIIKNNLRALSVNFENQEQMIENRSMMVVKHLKNGESNNPSWNEYFGNRTWPWSQTLFSLNMFVTLAERSA